MTQRAAIAWMTIGLAAGTPAASAAPPCDGVTFLPADGHPGDNYGYAVAVLPGWVFVGAPLSEDLGWDSGQVDVFANVPGSGRPRVATLHEPSGSELQGFGYSLAAGPDFVVAGQGSYHEPVHILRLGESGWTIVQSIPPVSGVDNDFFGLAVGAAVERVLVAARNIRKAYVYEPDAYGVWNLAATLRDWDGVGGYFGGAVAIDGDHAVVGAKDDSTQVLWAGSAYVFARDPNGAWLPEQKLFAHDAGSMWGFGSSVAMDGDRILVGAYSASAFHSTGGAAYMFERDPNGVWQETAQLINSDNNSGHFFGVSVALLGNLAIIGAENADGIALHSGAAYIFGPSGISVGRDRGLRSRSRWHCGSSRSCGSPRLCV